MEWLIIHWHNGDVVVQYHECPVVQSKEPATTAFTTTYFFSEEEEARKWLYEIEKVELAKLKARFAKAHGQLHRRG